VIAGLFDTFVGSEVICREIARCISMANDGVDAVLVVFSARTRFSEEEVAAVRSLETIFGSRILDYIIVVFTGGDDFEDNNGTFEDYLGRGCPPEPLKVTPKAANNFASLLLALKSRIFVLEYSIYLFS
jgi:hypothetical protein